MRFLYSICHNCISNTHFAPVVVIMTHHRHTLVAEKHDSSRSDAVYKMHAANGLKCKNENTANAITTTKNKPPYGRSFGSPGYPA